MHEALSRLWQSRAGNPVNDVMMCTSLDIPTEIPLVIGSASDGEPYPQPKGRMRAFLDALLSTVSIFGGDVDIPNDPVERESMF